MNKTEIMGEIRTLASGTQAALFRASDFDVIDAHVALWLQWVEQQPAAKTWESWVACFDEYMGRTTQAEADAITPLLGSSFVSAELGGTGTKG